jgi:hypothetical protein
VKEGGNNPSDREVVAVTADGRIQCLAIEVDFGGPVGSRDTFRGNVHFVVGDGFVEEGILEAVAVARTLAMALGTTSFSREQENAGEHSG